MKLANHAGEREPRVPMSGTTRPLERCQHAGATSVEPMAPRVARRVFTKVADCGPPAKAQGTPSSAREPRRSPACEVNMKVCGAFLVVELMRRGVEPEAACRRPWRGRWR